MRLWGLLARCLIGAYLHCSGRPAERPPGTSKSGSRPIRPGNLVRFAGYLAEARGGDGWRWRSSLTRDDTGDGACELVWVETLEVYC